MKCLFAWVVLGILSIGLAPDARAAETAVPDIGPHLELNWRASGSRLQCALERPIQDAGTARFVLAAGEPLRFELLPERPGGATGTPSVRVEAPTWHPEFPHQFDVPGAAWTADDAKIQLVEPAADQLLAALRVGHTATLTFITHAHSGRDGEVAVSGVGLGAAYRGYVECASQLFPTSFASVQKSVVNFEHDKSDLSPVARKRLTAVAEYVALDPQVTEVVIDGHTDSDGAEKLNLGLSKARAEVVAEFLVKSGLDPDLRVIRYHADRYPVAPNADGAGKARNRRTTVRLERAPEAASNMGAAMAARGPSAKAGR